jgi:hypothetical protein
MPVFILANILRTAEVHLCTLQLASLCTSLGSICCQRFYNMHFRFSALDSLIEFCYSCLVHYPWRELHHLCLAIKPRVFFQNHSLSRLRCSWVASAYGWVKILLYCLWLNKHIHYFLTGYGPTLSSDSLTAGR